MGYPKTRPWLPLWGPIPLVKGKCPEGTKGIGILARAQAMTGGFLRKGWESLRQDGYSLPPSRGKVARRGG